MHRREQGEPTPFSFFLRKVGRILALEGCLELACPAGFEPATHGLEGRCSVRAELRAGGRSLSRKRQNSRRRDRVGRRRLPPSERSARCRAPPWLSRLRSCLWYS